MIIFCDEYSQTVKSEIVTMKTIKYEIIYVLDSITNVIEIT